VASLLLVADFELCLETSIVARSAILSHNKRFVDLVVDKTTMIGFYTDLAIGNAIESFVAYGL